MQLPRVDPHARRGPAARLLHAFGRSRAGVWYGVHVAAPIDARLMRRTGGRLRLVGRSLPTAVLETVGAKSGIRREVPVVYFHPEADSDDVALIASSFGRDRHPAWFHNLLAEPACTLNGQAFLASDVTDKAAYERLFGLATQVYPGYADYRTRAAASGRRIPVLRLTPR